MELLLEASTPGSTAHITWRKDKLPKPAEPLSCSLPLSQLGASRFGSSCKHRLKDSTAVREETSRAQVGGSERRPFQKRTEELHLTLHLRHLPVGCSPFPLLPCHHLPSTPSQAYSTPRVGRPRARGHPEPHTPCAGTAMHPL